MGQYHSIYNKTKKETLNSFAFNSGTKLLEFPSSYMMMAGFAVLLSNSNGRGGGDLCVEKDYCKKTFKSLPLKGTKAQKQRAIDLISGRWAGDEIVIQGDYAKEDDKAFISETEIESYTDISQIVLAGLSADKWLAQEIEKNK